MKHKLTNNNGFSLLEVIAVIFIITVGLIGVLSLIVQNIQVQYINKNDLIASQLAQEGLELIRNQRDTNWLDGKNWDWKIQGNSSGAEHEVVYNDIPKSASGFQPLYIKTGFYTHESNGGAVPTPFSRLITITNVAGNDPFSRVVCEVQWQERGTTHTYKAETVLYDWY